jgi:hypothetical protein
MAYSAKLDYSRRSHFAIAQDLLNSSLDENSNFQPEKIIVLESTEVKK